MASRRTIARNRRAFRRTTIGWIWPAAPCDQSASEAIRFVMVFTGFASLMRRRLRRPATHVVELRSVSYTNSTLDIEFCTVRNHTLQKKFLAGSLYFSGYWGSFVNGGLP